MWRHRRSCCLRHLDRAFGSRVLRWGDHRRGGGFVVDLILLRVLLIAVVTALAFFLQPFGLPVSISIPATVLAAAGFILFERRARRMPVQRLAGAAAGSLVGIVAALLI